MRQLQEAMSVELRLKDAAADEIRSELAKMQEELKKAQDEKHQMMLELNTVQHKRKMDEAEEKMKLPELSAEDAASALINPCITVDNTMNQSKDESRLDSPSYTSERRSRKSRLGTGSPRKFDRPTANNKDVDLQVSVKMTKNDDKDKELLMPKITSMPSRNGLSQTK